MPSVGGDTEGTRGAVALLDARNRKDSERTTELASIENSRNEPGWEGMQRFPLGPGPPGMGACALSPLRRGIQRENTRDCESA